MAVRIGNNVANTINGTNQNDVVFAFGGDDLISTGAGNDFVFAGAGSDQIFAGDGSDWVFAGTGNDFAAGGNGNDFLYGEAGNDVLDGGRGSDIVDGGSGSDTLIFTDAERGGLDRYIGGSGADSLVLEFAAARFADPAVKAEVIAYLDFLAAGGTGNFTFTTMNLVVSSVEALVVKVDGAIIDPRAGGNTAPTGAADSYTAGENGVLDVSPATERGSLVDNDSTGTGAFTVELVTGPANGSLTLNADGTFSFNPGTAFDYLAVGQSAVETFTYRIVNSAGASAPVTVSLNIAGANDAATLGGVNSGEVSEDNSVTTAAGAISIADADAGQASLANPGTSQGAYGSLALAADGTWTYTIDNSLAATQALGAGDAATETFSISSADGTANSAITISVNGINDAATIAGELIGTVREDNFDPETESLILTASGQAIISDADSGEALAANPGTYEGAYGAMVLQADGSWVYTLNNDVLAVQSLGEDDEIIDTFNITSLDGSASALITVTVVGTNDLPSIDGVVSGTVNEDGFSEIVEGGSLTAFGEITIDDVDLGESGIPEPVSVLGLYGSFELATDGTWVYTLDNELAALQSLRSGETVNDEIIIPTIDGSGATINIEVIGSDDESVIYGQLSDTIILQFEDSSAQGFVTVEDIDTGESGVIEANVDGLYGTLSLQADGEWFYELLNYDLPFDEATTQITESFEMQTLGGDYFYIDVTIQQDGFIIG